MVLVCPRSPTGRKTKIQTFGRLPTLDVLLLARYNVTDSVRDALETLVKHASSQNRRIR